MSRVSAMVQDANLNFRGTSTPFLDLTSGATVYGSTINVGEEKELRFAAIVAGAVTGDSPSLAIAIQDSPTGTTWTTLASFPAITASMAGSVTGTFSGTAGLPRVDVITRVGYPYLRCSMTLTGSSTLAMASVAVLTAPLQGLGQGA